MELKERIKLIAILYEKSDKKTKILVGVLMSGKGNNKQILVYIFQGKIMAHISTYENLTYVHIK